MFNLNILLHVILILISNYCVLRVLIGCREDWQDGRE